MIASVSPGRARAGICRLLWGGETRVFDRSLLEPYVADRVDETSQLIDYPYVQCGVEVDVTGSLGLERRGSGLEDREGVAGPDLSFQPASLAGSDV